MKNRSSVTATIVCCARGIGVSDTGRDVLAVKLVGSNLAEYALGLFQERGPSVRAMRLALRALSVGIVDHNTIRMLVIDRYLRRWVGEGIGQLVILGAGLDARSWRMPELGRMRVFELDHPLSQLTKTSRVVSRGLTRDGVSFVPVDFETDDLAESLAQAGHQAHEPTIWICEGVTPYLKPSCIGRILHNAAGISAAGSKFIVSYVLPPRGARSSAVRSLVQLVIARLGEPARGALSEAAMHAYVESAGLRVLDDIDWERWKQCVGFQSRLPNILKERIVIAEQDGGK